VLPDGELRLRIEPRDDVVEMDVATIDEEDDGRDSYAFLPERADLADFLSNRCLPTPGFWGALGLIRLRAPVTCLAYGPDNRWALAGLDDGVQILNMRGGERAHFFGEHQARVTSVALSPHGLTALSADASGELLCWDLATRRVLQRRYAHYGAVNGLAISPAGDFAASCGGAGVMRLWDLAASCREWPLSDTFSSEEEVTALAFSADGHFLLSGDHAGRVDLWNVETAEHERAFRSGLGRIASLRCVDGVVTAVSTPENGAAVSLPAVARWRLSSGMAVHGPDEWGEPKTIAGCVTLDANGHRLLMGGSRPALAIQTPAVANVVSEVGEAVRDFFSFVPARLVRPRRRFSLEVWNVATGRCLHAYPTLPCPILHLAVSPDSTRVLAALSSGDVYVFAMPAR
jgi:WD40 repeat protein